MREGEVTIGGAVGWGFLAPVPKTEPRRWKGIVYFDVEHIAEAETLSEGLGTEELICTATVVGEEAPSPHTFPARIQKARRVAGGLLIHFQPTRAPFDERPPTPDERHTAGGERQDSKG